MINLGVRHGAWETEAWRYAVNATCSTTPTRGGRQAMALCLGDGVVSLNKIAFDPVLFSYRAEVIDRRDVASAAAKISAGTER